MIPGILEAVTNEAVTNLLTGDLVPAFDLLPAVEGLAYFGLIAALLIGLCKASRKE